MRQSSSIMHPENRLGSFPIKHCTPYIVSHNTSGHILSCCMRNRDLLGTSPTSVHGSEQLGTSSPRETDEETLFVMSICRKPTRARGQTPQGSQAWGIPRITMALRLGCTPASAGWLLSWSIDPKKTGRSSDVEGLLGMPHSGSG